MVPIANTGVRVARHTPHNNGVLKRLKQGLCLQPLGRGGLDAFDDAVYLQADVLDGLVPLGRVPRVWARFCVCVNATAPAARVRQTRTGKLDDALDLVDRAGHAALADHLRRDLLGLGARQRRDARRPKENHRSCTGDERRPRAHPTGPSCSRTHALRRDLQEGGKLVKGNVFVELGDGEQVVLHDGALQDSATVGRARQVVLLKRLRKLLQLYTNTRMRCTTTHTHKGVHVPDRNGRDGGYGLG